MRRLFSILFAMLILFNILGYYGLFLGLQLKNQREMAQKLDSEDYNDSEIITVKIPITIPYPINSEHFERVSGDFEYGGQFYQMVKQRFSNDTLYIMCVKDHQGKRINQAFVNYVKTFTDKPVSNTSSSGSKLFLTFSKDYIASTFSISHLSFGWQRPIVNENPPQFLTADFYPTIIHPPERA